MNLKCNRRIANWMTATAVAFLVTATASSVSAQVSDLRSGDLRSGELSGGSSFNPLIVRPASSQDKIKSMLKVLESTDNTSDKNAIEQEIKQLLNEQYDQKMKVYEKQLAELESKLEKMRSQLQRRRDAKADMVDLRMKVLMAEADDLGWPSDVKSGRFSAAFVTPGSGRSIRFDDSPVLPGKATTVRRWQLSSEDAKSAKEASIEALKEASKRIQEQIKAAESKAQDKN